MSDIFTEQICEVCHGSFTVHKHRGGVAEGTCLECGTHYFYGGDRQPLPEEGATYELCITVHAKKDGEWKVETPFEVLRTYTDRQHAMEGFEEVNDPEGFRDPDCKVWAMVRMWNADRSIGEWIAPEPRKGMRI